MANIARRPNGKYRARYRDPAGREHAKHFTRKSEAQRWLDEVSARLLAGTYADPATARMTVEAWCQIWLEGYAGKRRSTVRQARVHVKRIVAEFGLLPMVTIRPSQVKSWCGRLLGEGLAPSYVHALHGRLSQVMGDAVEDGILPRSPCNRKTSPGAGGQRPYVATTEQVWALHEAMPERLRAAVLLGAFAGLRLAEACGLRTADVDFMRGVIRPAVQYPAQPLKTEMSRTVLPLAPSLALELSAQVQRWPGATLLTDDSGSRLGPWTLERAFRAARVKAAGLPAGFRYHDLRHYLASLLIASGADIKTVQARLRHRSARTTLDTYGHLWPDRDESTKAAVERVFQDRADSVRTGTETR